MKLADGGFRPAYNMQITSAPKGQVIVAVDIDTTGSDRGLVRPALEQLSAAGTRPSDYLVDGGFTKNDDIEWAHENGIKLWCPPVRSKHGTDPFAPRPDDKPGVADWRRRMASAAGKELYKKRAQAECPQCLGAPHGPHSALCARQRQGPRRAAVVRTRPQHAARLRTAAGGHGRGKLRWSIGVPIL
jgi:hypothetical protein